MGPFETKTSQPPTIRNLSSGITKFHQKLYLSTLFWYNFNFWKTCWTYTEMLFSLHSKNEVILRTCSIYLVPIWDGLCKIFISLSIGRSDRYIQQIDRATTIFYNFCNFNIFGIVQLKFNSPIVLLHILSQNTCLNRLILIEYKNKWNILITLNLSCTSRRWTFWSILKNQLSQ